jgi:hypothetical protein
MGWIWIALGNGMLGVAGYWTARHAFKLPAGIPRVLAASLLAWVWLTLGVQALGSLGHLAVGPLLGWAGVGLLIAGSLRLWRHTPAEEEIVKGSRWEISAILALGLTLEVAFLIGANALVVPVRPFSDGPIYHLYFAARWWKAGRLFLIPTPFGETAAPYFPGGGDLWFTWLITLLGSDRLARVGQLPFLLLAAVAVFATSRRLGAAASAGVIAACWFSTCIPVLLQAAEPNVDILFVAGYIVAVYFGLRYAIEDGAIGSIILAGLAAGSAWGTKATGTVFIPVLLVIASLVIAVKRGSIARKVAHAVVLLIAVAIPCAFWFVRSAWLTGNPLYPLHVSLFGHVWLRGWYDSAAMAHGEFYFPAHEWKALVDASTIMLDARLVPFWLIGLTGGWLTAGFRPLSRWVWGVAALALLNIALFWLLIPYRTQLRFMFHTVGLFAIPLAMFLDRARGLRWTAVGLLLVHIFTPPSWPFAESGGMPPWRLTPYFPGGRPALIPIPLSLGELNAAWRDPGGRLGLVVLLPPALASLFAAWTWARAASLPTFRRKALAGLVTAALFGAVVLIADWDTQGASGRFFPPSREYGRAWSELEQRSGRDGVRVAYAGTNFAYYLMGSGLRNDVRYVNIDAHRDWLQHDYHRDAVHHGRPTWDTPRPGWDRFHPDYAAWLASLRAEGIQLLVVAKPKPEDGLFNIADREGFPIERQWAESHPEAFQPVYGVAESDPNMKIYRVVRSGAR